MANPAPGFVPHPVDVHVGQRVRARRMFLGITQEQLSAALGLTHQQAQKYEKGINRASASKLFEMAEILGVSPGYWFEGLPSKNGADAPTPETSALLVEFAAQPGAAELAQAYNAMTVAARRHLVSLAESSAAITGKAAKDVPAPAAAPVKSAARAGRERRRRTRNRRIAPIMD